MKIQSITYVSTVLALALGGVVAAGSQASASTGGGCRAWYQAASGLATRPCIGVHGDHVDARVRVADADVVSVRADLQELIPGAGWVTVDRREASGGGAHEFSFGRRITGNYFVVATYIETEDGQVSGPVDSPQLYLG